MTTDANERLMEARAALLQDMRDAGCSGAESERGVSLVEALIDAKLAAANVLRFDPDAPQDDCYTPGGDDGSAPDKDAVPSPRSEASGSPLPPGTSTDPRLAALVEAVEDIMHERQYGKPTEAQLDVLRAALAAVKEPGP